MNSDQREAINWLRDYCECKVARNLPQEGWQDKLAALDALLAELDWLRLAAPGAAAKFDGGQAMTIHGTV